jgi:outer membrane murein-binding lipoprotein Lpp
MKKILFTAAALSLLLFAGCQKNGVAPKQDSVSTKKSILNQSLNKGKDTIMVGGATTNTVIRDTIMVTNK